MQGRKTKNTSVTIISNLGFEVPGNIRSLVNREGLMERLNGINSFIMKRQKDHQHTTQRQSEQR